MVNLKTAKVYRDPVHDIISYEGEGDFGRLMVTLIDAPEVQRLRFVRQVGLASLVFHAAEHSRFSHSMGVAYVARRMFDQIHPEVRTDDARRTATIAAALLHDIGHGPFSHAMERVFGFHHEDYSRALVLDDDSEVCRVLRQFDTSLPESVAEYIGHSANHHTQDIVSGQLDADRCDYLLRDSYMTGVEVGRYDLERILLMLEYDDAGIIINVRAFESIEGYLIARYHMYRLVYFHRVVRAAEAMLRLMFERARLLLHGGDPDIVDSVTPLGRLMHGEVLPARVFCDLTEIEAWAQIRSWARHRDPVLADLASGLVTRRLFRAVERVVETPEQLARVVSQEAEIRDALGPEDRQLFIVDVAEDNPYVPYVPHQAERPIRVRERDGRVVRIEDKSPIVNTLAKASYSLRRWCFHPRLLSTITPWL